MTTVSYPSSDFPPPPQFACTIPDTWQADWPPGALLAAHGLADRDGIRPNLVVSAHRLSESTRFADVLNEAAERLRQATPSRAVQPILDLKIRDALSAALLSASFSLDSNVLVLQRQILLQVESPGPGTALLEITVTSGAHDIAVVQSIVDSLRFSPAIL